MVADKFIDGWIPGEERRMALPTGILRAKRLSRCECQMSRDGT